MKNEKKNTEFEHFSSLANDWWSKNGKFKILHEIQAIRIKYILETLNKKNLNNTTVLDIGCGGGLVSEGLSKIGATVTGIDFIKENIKVAKMHAKKNNLEIDYFVKDFEKEKITSKYDVIIILEVLEHLNNWEEFIKKIKLSLNKNGTLIISTININLVSKFLTLDIAENLLKLIPLNTHTFYKFIQPEELEQVLSSYSFENIKFKGLTYNALQLKWKISENTKINYFCSCKFI